MIQIDASFVNDLRRGAASSSCSIGFHGGTNSRSKLSPHLTKSVRWFSQMLSPCDQPFWHLLVVEALDIAFTLVAVWSGVVLVLGAFGGVGWFCFGRRLVVVWFGVLLFLGHLVVDARCEP